MNLGRVEFVNLRRSEIGDGGRGERGDVRRGEGRDLGRVESLDARAAAEDLIGLVVVSEATSVVEKSRSWPKVSASSASSERPLNAVAEMPVI